MTTITDKEQIRVLREALNNFLTKGQSIGFSHPHLAGYIYHSSEVWKAGQSALAATEPTPKGGDAPCPKNRSTSSKSGSSGEPESSSLEVRQLREEIYSLRVNYESAILNWNVTLDELLTLRALRTRICDWIDEIGGIAFNSELDRLRQIVGYNSTNEP